MARRREGWKAGFRAVTTPSPTSPAVSFVEVRELDGLREFASATAPQFQLGVGGPSPCFDWRPPDQGDQYRSATPRPTTPTMSMIQARGWRSTPPMKVLIPGPNRIGPGIRTRLAGPDPKNGTCPGPPTKRRTATATELVRFAPRSTTPAPMARIPTSEVRATARGGRCREERLGSGGAVTPRAAAHEAAKRRGSKALFPRTSSAEPPSASASSRSAARSAAISLAMGSGTPRRRHSRRHSATNLFTGLPPR